MHAGDVGLLLKGSLIANNSVVLISGIGRGKDALLCTTNEQTCCNDSSSKIGNLFFPNNFALGSSVSGGGIYQDRTDGDPAAPQTAATVRLNHRNGATGPTGLYRCVISDSYGVEQTLFVGIYTSNVNSKLMLFSLLLLKTLYIVVTLILVVAMVAPLTSTFQLTSVQGSVDITFTLTCNSSGGPVSGVTWTRDGFLLDNTGPLVLTDTSTASYTNVLEVNSRVPGLFTCQIRGTNYQVLSSMDFRVQGILHQYKIPVQKIFIL